MSRVAVVTGGTRGIGAAISKALKETGCTVAAIYGGNEEAAAKFKEETGIAVYKCDVSDHDACAKGLGQVEKDLGAVDILVNNAGITRDTMFHRMDVDKWRAVIDTNLNSLFNMCRPVIEGMRERKFGRIINISSINGQKGQMGQTNYSAAKAGELGFKRLQGHHRQRHLPRLYRHRDGARGARRRAEGENPSPYSCGTSGRAGRDCTLRGVSGL
jgi:acetoacetyl-CoA reductase